MKPVAMLFFFFYVEREPALKPDTMEIRKRCEESYSKILDQIMLLLGRENTDNY